jgi:hypothetical protein
VARLRSTKWLGPDHRKGLQREKLNFKRESIIIMFGAVLPSLLIGFGTTKSTWASEPTLSWNQIVRIAPVEAITH